MQGTKMRVRGAVASLAAVAALAGLLAPGCAKQSAQARVVGVSEVKANAAAYLGPLTIRGLAGNVYAEDGVVEISDEKACCSVFLLVPTGEAQRAKLGTEGLYRGTLPRQGDAIEAQGELVQSKGGYAFVVRKISGAGGVIVERI